MNKTKIAFLSLSALAVMAFAFQGFSKQQEKEPWTDAQLMPPSDLAQKIRNGEASDMYIYSVGPAGLIKNAIDIGEGRDLNNLAKLKAEVSKLPKNAHIVLYCGCCPFGDCPNIRPTFRLLNELEFTNHQLLNLPNNLKVDWIDKGYPMHE